MSPLQIPSLIALLLTGLGGAPDATDNTADNIAEHGADEAVFTATFRGRPLPATRRRLVRLLVTMPLMTHRTSLLIRIHGVWLWLRRLPVVPRPHHEPQEGTTR